MKRILGVLGILCPLLMGAQEVKPLGIGDAVPDLTLSNISSYPSATARLSDFRGRLLILDFWEAYCGACIRALPKLDSLQKAFGDQVQVLTVTQRNSAEELARSLHQIKLTRGIKLPTVTHDSVLHRLFPHEILSHVVWIDGKGTVKAITGAEYVTAANVKALLAGEAVRWPVKNDRTGFDAAAPFLLPAGGVPAPCYSVLTPHWEGVPQTASWSRDSSTGRQTVSYYNLSLLQLLRVSVENAAGTLNSKMVVWNGADPARYVCTRGYRAEWRRKNTWCYSQTLPLRLSKEDVQCAVREDLARWLLSLQCVSMEREVRVVPCLALVRTGKVDKLASRGGERENTLSGSDPVRRLRNTAFADLAAHLNSEVPGIPWVVDETGIAPETKVDMELYIPDWSDTAAVRKAVRPYGLDLVPVRRERMVYVVREAASRKLQAASRENE